MSLPSNKFFLIGMPGSGKSTVGRELAERMSLPFIDLDAEVEQTAGCSIKEIFSECGEFHFRELEREALHKVAHAKEGAVIATGGGTPCFFDNMNTIRRCGSSVFIDVPMEVLVERLSAYEKGKRPKFAGAPLEETLKKLLKERRHYYQQADYHWAGMQSIKVLAQMLKKNTESSS